MKTLIEMILATSLIASVCLAQNSGEASVKAMPQSVVKTVPVAGDAPVILIYSTIGYPPPVRPGESNPNISPRLVAALWNDGRMIWSESRIAGGPPHRQGRFTGERLVSLLGSLEAQGAFTNAALRRPWFGPDSKTTRIAINDGRRRLMLESWHELYEQNSNTVATAAGLEPLQGRNREAVLREQPEEYRQFRNTWSEIRRSVEALIPRHGEPYGGKIPIPDK